MCPLHPTCPVPGHLPTCRSESHHLAHAGHSRHTQETLVPRILRHGSAKTAPTCSASLRNPAEPTRIRLADYLSRCAMQISRPGLCQLTAQGDPPQAHSPICSSRRMEMYWTRFPQGLPTCSLAANPPGRSRDTTDRHCHFHWLELRRPGPPGSSDLPRVVRLLQRPEFSWHDRRASKHRQCDAPLASRHPKAWVSQIEIHWQMRSMTHCG